MRFNFFHLLAALVLATGVSAFGQSLIKNGDFKDSADPFKGWVTDYAWAKNKFYNDNKNFLTIGNDGGRTCVNFADAGDAGVKMETCPFPFEPGFKYTCTLDIKGGPCRVYFAGYQWIPGIRPHDNPDLSELRMIYQSKAFGGSDGAWKQGSFTLPGVVLSDDAIAHLKKVRYLTVYIYMLKPGSVANVTVTKAPDPSMNF